MNGHLYSIRKGNFRQLERSDPTWADEKRYVSWLKIKQVLQRLACPNINSFKCLTAFK